MARLSGSTARSAWRLAESGQGRAPVSLGRDFVDRVRQADVELAEAARVMRRQYDLDPVVDVEELGVVVHFLRQERHSRHEAPGFGEVLEMVALADRVAVLDLGPAMKPVQRRLSCCAD